MKNLNGIGLSLCFLYVLCVSLVTGSVWLQDPPSRSAAWYYQIKAPVNYNFRNLDCGGIPVGINGDGSRNCGLCGDSYELYPPRPNEKGGKYANPIIRTRYYEEGQKAEISIWNNLPGSPGFYEFRLCTDALNADQSCLNDNLLTILDNNKTNIPVPKKQGLNMLHVQLPVGVTCEYCLLQWRFRKENSVIGCDGNNWCGVGRGPQIEYYNCADVTIGAVGQPKPGYIKDPVYSAADYGSAYDVFTTLTTTGGGRIQTTPPSGGLDGTTPGTNRVPIFTIPTLPPVTGNPSVTTASPGATITERLVVDASGNSVGTLLSGTNVGTSSGGGGTNNRQLLLLLGLLPLLGAAALRNNNRPPALPISSGQPGFYAGNPPLSEYYLGTGIGFGNFGPGAFGAPLGFNNGFGPGAPFAPGRFGRSVSDNDSISSFDQEFQANSVVQYNANHGVTNQMQESNVITMEMNNLEDFAFNNGEFTNEEIEDEFTHVHQYSQDSGSADHSVIEATVSALEDQGLHLSRSKRDEYGQSGTTYGNTNNMAGQQNTFQTGNQAQNRGNTFQPTPHTMATGPLLQNSGNSILLAQRRRMRNKNAQKGHRMVSQDSSDRRVKDVDRRRQFQSEDGFHSDFEGLMKTLGDNRGFFASRNPLAGKLFGRKRPTSHDWYLKLMARSPPLSPNVK